MTKNPSDKTITGVIYFVASLTASIEIQKQSAAEDGAKTIRYESEGLPYRDINKSPCSVLVGIPVEIPDLIKSKIINGNSVITAKFIASTFNAIPGPELPVIPSLPAYAAPRAIVTAAISSSV